MTKTSRSLRNPPPCQVRTPTLDKLASGGVKFMGGHVTSTLCTPSRWSALNGRFASRSQDLLNDYPAGGPVRCHRRLHPRESFKPCCHRYLPLLPRGGP